MTSELQNNYDYEQFFSNEKLSNVDILNNFLASTGEVISSETFKKIMDERALIASDHTPIFAKIEIE